MKPLPHVLPCLLALVLAAPAQAQAPATKSIGGNVKSGTKLLTREELRACLNRQTELTRRRDALNAERDALQRERADFDQGARALDADRDVIAQLDRAASDLNQRMQAQSQQVADYNERVARFERAGLSGMTEQRQRQALDRDKAELEKTGAALQAERAELSTRAEAAAKAHNERVASRNLTAADWNERSAKLTRQTQAYEEELSVWRADCEGRPYREDDEKAILSGR